MRSFKLKRELAVWAIALLSIIIPSISQAATTEEAIAKCDTLASHPRDPGRYAAGVTDEQFAPGAAIDACKNAVAANPDFPRSWFQLGRAYWLADRDKDAFAAFVQAAKRDYAPAMKFIGDAYNEGRGLPPGEKQDLPNAIEWYKKSAAAGFRDATTALKEANDVLASSRFNPALFQNSSYMTKLYNSDFANIDNPIIFFAYVHAFSDRLGGDTVFFIDQQCAGMVTALSGIINGVQQLASYLNTLQGENGLAKVLISSALANIAEDQGIRDANSLMHNYSCKSPVTKKIVDNVIGSYQKAPAIINATLGKGSGSPDKTTPSNAAGVKLYKEELNTLYWSVVAGDCSWKSMPGCEKLLALMKDSSFDIIQCTYGPVNSDNTGYKRYSFWHTKVPDNISSYSIPGQKDHPFLILGKVPVAKCPATAAEMEPVF